MVRRFVTLFVVLCLGWQTLAFAGVDAIAATDADKQHELLHFKGIAHHHHDEADAHGEHGEAFHLDDSMASTLHVLADAGQFSPVLPTPHSLLPAMLGAEQPAADHLAARALLMPGGLDRPPKRST